MAKDNDRFERVYSQGVVNGVQIWMDKETGVNYLVCFNGNAGGATVLLDSQGKPLITPEMDRERYR